MSKEFIPSPSQSNIFHFAENGTESAIVTAVAGAGKTTTLVQMFRRLPQNLSILMLAFNKTIADELKSRVPGYVQAATFHSIGYSAWNKYAGKKVQIDANKVKGIMREFLSPRDNAIYGSFVLKMISLAKAAGMGAIVENVESEWVKLSQHFDVTPDTEDANIQYGIELARQILKRSISEAREIIDFDDMLFMPLIENVAFPKYDIVCIDEAQDTNGVQRALLKRMLVQPSGRLIAVGDPKQAIYGFRGADSSAMARIKQEFACIDLPLTVSYRCPQAVVRHAQSIVPYIEAHESAPEGLVAYNPGNVDDSGKFVGQSFRAKDAIICRNTAPLVSLAYNLIGKRIGCQILGRDISKGLTDLIEKMNAKGIDALIEKLAEWERREVDKLVAKDQTDKAEGIRDKVSCINICISALPETERTVPALINSINRLFSDKDQGVLTLCTVHKAKGLEWERVYILDADCYMPSKWARQAWQKEQEENLMYVAYTRAKLELYFITTEHVEKSISEGTVAAIVAEPAAPKKATRAPGMIEVSDKVEVKSGKKVPIGTRGTVIHCFGAPWFGIVLKDETGRKWDTYAKNVNLIE